MAAKVLGEPQLLGVQALLPDQITRRMTVKIRPTRSGRCRDACDAKFFRAYDENGIELP